MIENITLWESIIVALQLLGFVIFIFLIEWGIIYIYWRWIEFKHHRKQWHEALQMWVDAENRKRNTGN